MERLRSPFFVSAHDSFQKIAEGGKFDFSTIQRCFDSWLERYASGRYARLVEREKSSSFLFIRLYNRFMADYRAKLKKKLAFLHFVKFRTFLTLTVDPKKFLRLSDEYLFVSKAWSKLRQAESRHGRFFYLRILEVTKIGRPHLHILTTIPFINIRRVRKLWVKYGGGVICKVRRCGDRLNGLSYLLKYVTKTLCIPCSLTSQANHISAPGHALSVSRLLEEPNKTPSARGFVLPLRAAGGLNPNLFGSLLFASNRRLFSFNDCRTRSFILDKSPVTKCDSLPKYDYDGTVTLALIEAYCVEYGIALMEKLKLRPDLDQEILFSSLFGTGELTRKGRKELKGEKTEKRDRVLDAAVLKKEEYRGKL